MAEKKSKMRFLVGWERAEFSFEIDSDLPDVRVAVREALLGVQDALGPEVAAAFRRAAVRMAPEGAPAGGHAAAPSKPGEGGT